jgi:hypothetical protein
VTRLAERLQVIWIIRSALELWNDVVTAARARAMQRHSNMLTASQALLAQEIITLEYLLPQPAPSAATTARASPLTR